MEQCSNCKYWAGTDNSYSAPCRVNRMNTVFSDICEEYTSKSFQIKKNTPLTEAEIEEFKNGNH